MQYNRNNLDKAKNMRSNMTEAESLIWRNVRAKRFLGLKFKRQVLIGKYIVDFLCPEKSLIIEVDGGQHNEDINIQNDKERTEYLVSQGYYVLRYWNNDVLNDIDGVLCDIKNHLNL